MWSLLDFFPEPLQLTVLDVGAAIGEPPPYESLVRAGRARLFGFEPNREECDKLNRSYGPPHRFFPYFAGDGKPGTFHETNWNLTGSLYEPNTPLLQKFQNLAEVMTPVAQHPVQTVRLDDLPEIDDVDFIKIDVQGAELSVFQNAVRILGKAVLIQCEAEFVPMYKGQPLFADIDTFLRGQGYQFHCFHTTAGRTFRPLLTQDEYGYVRQLLWSDVLYVRDWMKLEALDEQKLKKCAVLLHDMVESYDLADVMLAELDRRSGSALAPAYRERLLKDA